MKDIPVSPHNYRFELDHDGETNTEPSLTTPDQTMSLREMLTRYSRGQSVPTFDPVYDQDEDMPDISTMSKIQIEELRQDVLGEIQFQQYELNRKAEAAAEEHKTKAKTKAKAKPAAKPVVDAVIDEETLPE